jgi:hypothetical protein
MESESVGIYEICGQKRRAFETYAVHGKDEWDERI